MFNKSSVVKILNELQKDLSNKQSFFDEAIKIDYKVSRFKTDFDILYNISQNVSDFDGNMITPSKNIAVIYDGNPYITITLAIKALQTNNNITFFADDNMIATNEVLIKLINLLLENNNYTNNTISFVNSKLEDVIKIQNNYDLLLYIGSKYEYHKIKNNFKIKTLHNGYGTATFYISSEDESCFESILNDINEYIYKNNIISDVYNENNISVLIEKTGKFEPDDIFVVFSNNSNTLELLKKSAKYKRIFINQNPFTNYCYLFSQDLP